MSFFRSERFPQMKKKVSVAIVRSQFNTNLTEELLETTLQGLSSCGISPDSVEEFLVPGALEIPGVVRRLQDSGNFQGIIALGVVIRGETNHYEIVTEESARGLMECSLRSNVPVINGILGGENTNHIEMRLEKGLDFAKGLVEMMILDEQIEN